MEPRSTSGGRRIAPFASAVALVAVAATAAHAEPPKKPKSRTVAEALAGVGTGISAALAFSSLFLNEKSGFGNANEVANPTLLIAGLATSIVTPSLGQYYAGQYWSLGMGLRAGSAGAIAIGAFVLNENPRCVDSANPDGMEHHCPGLTEAGVAVIALGVIGYIGGIALDFYDTPEAVDRYNQTLGIYMSPSVSVTADGTPIAGLAGRF